MLSLASLLMVHHHQKLNKQDWKDIAQDVSKYAIVGEDEDYTILIFNLY